MLATENTAMYSEPLITLSKLPARMPLLTIWRIASGIARSKITWPSSAAWERSSQRRPRGEAQTARSSWRRLSVRTALQTLSGTAGACVKRNQPALGPVRRGHRIADSGSSP